MRNADFDDFEKDRVSKLEYAVTFDAYRTNTFHELYC